jgi:hypothetical protein
MKINLAGSTLEERIAIAMGIVRERHGNDWEGASITLKVNNETIKTDGKTLEFFDAEAVKPLKQRERHYYWRGFLAQRRCAFQR